jgi:hypothetical protein
MNILITADDLGIIKIWDLQSYKPIQSTKIKASKNVYKIKSLGLWGFVIFTSNLNFFSFENNSEQYVKVDDSCLPKKYKLGEMKQFGVIPQINFCKNREGVM